jgi:hypothetical protein
LALVAMELRSLVERFRYEASSVRTKRMPEQLLAAL